MHVLLIEDDRQQAANLAELIANLGHQTAFETDPQKGLQRFAESAFDLVISDLRMPGIDGLTVMKKILEQKPDTRLIILTAYGTIETAVTAMKQGAFDFLVKPVEEEKLQTVLTLAESAARLAKMAELSAPKGPPGDDDFLAVSTSMRRIKDLIRRVALLTTTVLISGETGTGKELVARAIHLNSPRKSKPFVAVNCANLMGNLLESELFGHEKGAFTGADTRKLGKFELATGGTLFLDEIAEIPLDLQAKLLRALQEQEIERVGGNKTIRVDVRLVSATNKNLAKMVEEGHFRSDLFYRLNVFPLTLPPLRERSEEIPALAQQFLLEMAVAQGRTSIPIASEAITWLKQQKWAGNIRELKNVLERAGIIDDDGIISVADLSLGDHEPDLPLRPEALGTVLGPPLPIPGKNSDGTLTAILEDRERQTLVETLEKLHGNVVAVARELGVPRRTLYVKLKKFSLDPDRYRRQE
jgi:DNA-binding NtrC family response regulator